MSKSVVIISLALLASVAIATNTAGSSNLVSSAFNATAVKVFDVTNTTDKTDWLPATIPTSGVIFGPGSDNTTVWAYGVTYTSGSVATNTLTQGTISGLVARKVSVSTLTSGNDTSGTELSVAPSSDVSSTSLTLGNVRPPVLAVGNGYLAAATTSYASSKISLVIYIWAAGSTTATTATIVTASAADSYIGPSTSTDYNIGNVWYQDGYFYIVYSLVSGTGSSTSITAWTESAVYLQAIGASNASALYSSPVAVVTSLTATISTYSRIAPTTSLYPIGGPSNYTTPSYVYVLYKSSGKIYGVPVSRTAGTAGSANTLTSDVTYASGTTTGFTFTPSGVWYTNTSYGALISNQTEASGGSTFAYALTSCNVSTCADSGLGVFSSAVTTSGSVVSSFAFIYNNTGYGIIASYPTSTTSPATYGFTEQTFNSSGSATSTSATTIGTVQGTGNFFLNSVYSVWFGYAIADTANSADVYSGYIARVLYTEFPTTSSFGNVLASFFAFLTLLLAFLFAF